MMNAMIDVDDRINMKKIDLIQQATTRLRRRQLEEQLSGMMAYMAEIQTQSKHIYDQITCAMTTTQHLTDYDIGQQHTQMDLLEKQVILLQSMQQRWFPSIPTDTASLCTTDDNGANDINGSYGNHGSATAAVDDDQTASITMSRLSSLSMISSLFSRPISRATSVSEFTDVDSTGDDHDFRHSYATPSPSTAALDQQWNQFYRHQRRLRTKNHRKRYQDRQRLNGSDDRDDVLADLVIASPPSASATMKRPLHQKYNKVTSMLALPLSTTARDLSSSSIPLPSPPMSPLSSSNSCRSSTFPQATLYPHHHAYLPSDYSTSYDLQEDDIRTDVNDYCGSVDSQQRLDRPKEDAHYNVFEDTMDFLEQMDAALAKKTDGDDDGYDDQFFQDMTFLLDHPELCNQPLADLAPLLEQHHQQQQQESDQLPRSLSTMRSYGPTHGPSPSSPYLKDLCSSGWQWYRFLSVLSASYVVSLLKGPDDLLID
ncbi:hypothetical protein [Absidia glauca]|uniref:Uncharacterized protein n=1 Tax=Absidia glauca TaxID=4829 RepID=A0A168NSU0_ABSGL|nr:hypothetical protein [Absidia glauca]